MMCLSNAKSFELQKTLNLNTFEWRRNYRRVVTFGGFLVCFGYWANPVIQESRNKNPCVCNLPRHL